MCADGSNACKAKEDKLMAVKTQKIGSLWKRKDGKPGYSGKLDDGRSILLLPNEYKTSDGPKAPDIKLFVVFDDESPTPPKKMPHVQDDDIPF
jgi:hypothetical protein